MTRGKTKRRRSLWLAPVCCALGTTFLIEIYNTRSGAWAEDDADTQVDLQWSEEGPPQDFLPVEVSPGSISRMQAPINPLTEAFTPSPPDALFALPFIPSNVNVSMLADNEAEVSIDVNPTDPNNLVIVGHIDGFDTMNTFFSMDGGETWDLVELGNADDGLISGFRFDPALAFDDDGNVYVGYGVKTDAGGGATQRTVVVCKSTDGGQSYPQCTLVNTNIDIDTTGDGVTNLAGNDKWMLATGPDPFGAGQQNVYIAWTQNVVENGNLDQRIVLSASTDGGANFSAPIIVADDAIAGIDRGLFADPAVGPNGELYVSWHDFGADEVLIDVSFDAGTTFGTDMLVTSVSFSGLFENIPAQPDRGITVGPTIDTDRTGSPFDGRIYIVYTDIAAGGLPDTDVFVRYSDNDGANWSAATLVNDDGGMNSQFLPWLDVDNCSKSEGRVSVVFYDARNDTNNEKVEVFMAVSEDGGDTFEPNVQVSSGQSDQSASNPSAWANNFLEYIGVAACNDVACAVWSDNSTDPANLDYFSDCVPISNVLPLDIKPGSCPNSFNRNSNGVMPVGLLGTESFDITLVDVSTVELSRADGIGGFVQPNEGPPGPHSVFADVGTPFEGQACDCHELEGDTILDLSMKFRSNEVTNELQLNSLDSGALVELTLTGMLLDGTPFVANDCIRLVPPGTPPGVLLVGSNLFGVWIVASPLDDQLDAGGFTSFNRSYPQGSFVTVTVPIVPDAHPWWILDSWWIDGVQVPGSGSTSTMELVIDSDIQAIALLYRPPGQSFQVPDVPNAPE